MNQTTYSTNPIWEKLQKGQRGLGTFVFSPDPCHTEIIRHAGFDLVVIDMEHAPLEIGDVAAHTRAANATGISCWARVGHAEPQQIGRLLDQGIHGIVLPHFGLDMTHTQEVLKAFRYAPDGTRGTCSGVRSVSYGLMPVEKYANTSKAQSMAIGLIEDASVVNNIESVLANCKLDAIVPGGPGDLATSMGFLGQGNHPEVIAAVKRIVLAGKSVPGLKVGIYLIDPKTAGMWIDLGVDFFLCSIDYRVMANAYQAIQKEMTSQGQGQSAACLD